MLDTFLPGMKALNKGHIVFLSSMAGVIGLKNLVPYCASKFAVRGWCCSYLPALKQYPKC